MKTKIYTKTGDSGETSLVSGTRIKKSDPRIDIYGEVDELNSWLGMIISLLKEDTQICGVVVPVMEKLQSNFFTIGSILACESENREKLKLKAPDINLIEELEGAIDAMTKNLPPLNNFILPGGTLPSAYLHVIRTVVRRIERKMVNYNEKNSGEIPDDILKLINRLSDYLFVLARDINHKAQRTETIYSGQ